MPMGPLALMDEVGLDIAAKVAHVLYGAFGERMKPPAAIDVVTEQGRLGKRLVAVSMFTKITERRRPRIRRY